MTILIQGLNDVIYVLTFMALGIVWGVATIKLLAWSKNLKAFIITKIWQERNGEFYLMKRRDVPLSTELVDVGDFQWHIDAKNDVEFYEGGHPIVNLEMGNSKPLIFMPNVDTTAPSARALAKTVKREWVKQWMMATKPFDIKAALPIIIIAAIMGLSVGALIMMNYHPGLVPQAPPGYFYKVEPIPANATVVH